MAELSPGRRSPGAVRRCQRRVHALAARERFGEDPGSRVLGDEGLPVAVGRPEHQLVEIRLVRLLTGFPSVIG